MLKLLLSWIYKPNGKVYPSTPPTMSMSQNIVADGLLWQESDANYDSFVSQKVHRKPSLNKDKDSPNSLIPIISKEPSLKFFSLSSGQRSDAYCIIEDYLIQFTVDLNIITSTSASLYDAALSDPLSLLRYEVTSTDNNPSTTSCILLTDKTSETPRDIYFVLKILQGTVLGIISSQMKSGFDFATLVDAIFVLATIFAVYPKKNFDDVSIPAEGILAILVSFHLCAQFCGIRSMIYFRRTSQY